MQYDVHCSHIFQWVKVAIQLLIAFILKLIMYLIFVLIYYCHLSLFCIHVHLQNPGFHSIRSQFYALGSRACLLERSCQHYFLFTCLIKAQSDKDSIYGLYFVLHSQVQLQIAVLIFYTQVHWLVCPLRTHTQVLI